MLETNPKRYILASGNNDCDGDDDGELPRKIFFPGAKILSTGKINDAKGLLYFNNSIFMHCEALKYSILLLKGEVFPNKT